MKSKSKMGRAPKEISWKILEKCIYVLQLGIPAVKYNYHNMKCRRVMLSLTHNGSRLTCTNQDAATGLLCGFDKHKSTSYPLKDFFGFLYGGQTITFIKHRDKFF